MKKHTVYITENKVNNKLYIGYHLTNKSYDNYFGSGILIQKAIKKYGKEKFQKIILGEFNNYPEARHWEEFYIQLFKTEIKYGGSPDGGKKVSNETKEKLKGKIPWNKGKKTGPRSEETKNSISNSLKDKRFTEERKRNISKSLMENIPWNKDKKMSETQKEKLKGRVPWNKGLKIGPRSEEVKNKISTTLKKKKTS